MQICRLLIRNFRGIKSGVVNIEGNSVLVGDNNSGKSTIFEAIDLVMGPDRLSKRPVIDEHDFYAGEYIVDGEPVEISIEVTVIDLNDNQLRHFGNYIEWWDKTNITLLEGPPASETDRESVIPALRLTFKGGYDPEEDDFYGQSFYATTIGDSKQAVKFTTKDKRNCGFLYLRTLRTGSRALSLEKGSLLDVILQLREVRPRMWENTLEQLKSVVVATDPDLGIDDILTSVQESISTIVAYESGEAPRMRVSSLTREHLRKILTVFLGTGSKDSKGNEYATPYYNQGTGTINTLVLTLLSMIAEMKDSVIFAMEEPEIALPPHIQKRSIISVMEHSNQALFTSHSPYVIEELPSDHVLVVSRKDGLLKAVPAKMPPIVKSKAYRDEIRRRFCEALLSRRVIITEGKTEYDVYTTAARKLQKLHPEKNLSFELLGIAPVNAESDSKIAELGIYYKKLNKTVYAVFDKQEGESLNKIAQAVDYFFEGSENGIEKEVLNGVSDEVLIRYGLYLVDEEVWPANLQSIRPHEKMSAEEIYSSLFKYFTGHKGDGALADFIDFCSENELPEFIVKTIYNISETIYRQNDTECEIDNSVVEECLNSR